jgi:hypothetical protein
VIRTELPDGSESRVEFDAWQQTTFDPNDAIAGTPWLTQHQTGTADEQRAALLALKHADTPTIAHLDSLGRTFLVQTDNGPDPATPTGTHRLYDTRTQFDIEGNVLSITDARGVQVIQQRFDVLQRRLRVDSPDAGARLAVADVAGKPLRAWDSRAQTMRSQYDALQRPTHVFVAVGASERLLLRTVFGESLDPPGVPAPTSPAQALNLRGKPYLAFDCAGLVTAAHFDFKGNLLASSRRLATDYTSEPNWIGTENPIDPAVSLSPTAHSFNDIAQQAMNPSTEQIANALAAARQAISTQSNEWLIGPVDTVRKPVAMLVTVDGLAPQVVLLMYTGTNEIGRGCAGFGLLRGKLKGVIEGWQWLVQCSELGATIQDTRSTAGSIMCAAGSPVSGLQLGWDGQREHRECHALPRLSILRNQYWTFAFDWI